MNKHHCKEFKQNSLINPLTKRTIKKNGPTYKKLRKECDELSVKTYDNTSSYDLNYYCKKFKKNPEINPFTNSKIKLNGSTYKNLKKNCTEIVDNQDKIYKQLCDKWKKNNRLDPITRLKINNSKIKYWNSFCNKSYICSKSKCISNTFRKSPTKFPTKSPTKFPTKFPTKSPRKIKKINTDDSDNNIFNTKKFGKFFFDDNSSKWIIDKFLGKGGYGNVFLTYEEKNPKDIYAVKIQSRYDVGALNELQFFKTHKYNTNYIVDFIFSTVTETYIYLVFEKLEKYTPSIETFPNLIRNLEYLSKLKISHGDIKFLNIMTRNNKPILIDFGLYLDISRKKQQISGTLYYMSVNAHNGIIAYKNDLESLCYCILHIYKILPWSKLVLNKELDHEKYIIKKEKFKKKFIENEGNIKNYSDILPKLKKFIIEVFKLKDNSLRIPNYNKFCSILE